MTSLRFHAIFYMSQVARHLHVRDLLSFLSRVEASCSRYDIGLCADLENIGIWYRRDDVTGTLFNRLQSEPQGETDPIM